MGRRFNAGLYLRPVSLFISLPGFRSSYRNLWSVLEEDKEIAVMFNDLKRSNAIFKLTAWKRNGLLSNKELQDFSETT